MGSEKNQEHLTAAHIGDAVVIRVKGRGSFKTSPPMKKFIHQIIDTHSAKKILVDMAGCTGMDSTFMGVVAGIACYIANKPDVQFKLINLSKKNQNLLVTLGVDRVVDYSLSASDETFVATGDEEVEVMDTASPDKLEAAKTSLEAHASLIDINPENYSKFKAVVELLQNDVDTLNP